MTNQTHKQGDYREDGYRFVSYKPLKKKDGSQTAQWLNPTSFHRFKIRAALNQAKARSRAVGKHCDLDLEYLQSLYPVNNKCPILGIDLEWNGDGRFNAPSLDKIIPELGYTKGNVAWVSLRANRMKDNATVEQLEAIIAYIKTFSDYRKAA